MSQTLVWKHFEDEGLKAVLRSEDGQDISVAWAPQPGSQTAFLNCPVFECLYEGTRGPGKTDALLMDFLRDVGKGHGAEWRGILFRRTYPELQDAIDKSKKWFKKVFPTATYNEGKSFWSFPDGEKLYFRHFMKEADYWSYHGHAYPWQGWEELTTWPDSKCYTSMFACARSSVPNIPIRVRATTNPYGVGHNWVKARWRLPLIQGYVISPIIMDSLDDEGNPEPPRVAIHGELSENRILLTADPGYRNRIAAAARNKSELKAWLYGDWNVVAGGMFDDVWVPKVHVIPNIPPHLIPPTWRIDRSYDHGQSRPFSVGWWAESNGEPIQIDGKNYGQVPGDMFRIAEWYGWTGKLNEGVRMLSTDIAQGILDREEDWGILNRVRKGPADSSIFDDYEPGKSVAGDMKSKGVRWAAADKRPGSRKQGWEQIRKLLKQAMPEPRGVRENPGIFIMERCTQFIRTVPVLPRSDKDPDDVNTDAEDHIGDEVRYRVRQGKREIKRGKWK